MEKYLKPMRNYFQKVLIMVIALISGFVAFAQDKSVDVNISTNKGNNFWASPWVWVVGAAVFILLLVAILRGGGRRDA